MNDPNAAAYGGPGWSPRLTRMVDEIGDVWGAFAVNSESTNLKSVLLHRPGEEVSRADDPDEMQMLAKVDPDTIARQHDELADTYRAAGVQVHYVEPEDAAKPNQMFVADLMFMTPSGAVVGRPASTVRAGEERCVARRLADLGIPILRSVAGSGTFEGADAIWLSRETVLIGCGLRTNAEGAAQVAEAVQQLGARALVVDLPHTAMHLMGSLRIVDRDLAYVRSGGIPWSGIDALRADGYQVRPFPNEEENRSGMAHNFVTLGPRRILMPADNPESEREYKETGIEVLTVGISEIAKAAGAIGCLSGILSREVA